MKKRINITLNEETIIRLDVFKDHHPTFNRSNFIDQLINNALGPPTPTEEIALALNKKRKHEREL